MQTAWDGATQSVWKCVRVGVHKEVSLLSLGEVPTT